MQFLKISIPPPPKDVSGNSEGSQNAKRLKESLTGISRGGGANQKNLYGEEVVWILSRMTQMLIIGNKT